MTKKAVIASLAGMLALGVLLAPGALASKPTIERFEIDESFPDDFLTEACSVPVTTR